MNKLLSILFLLSVAFAINLQIQSKIDLYQSYQLHCLNAHGRVTYFAEKLPSGVSLNEDKIQVEDASKLRNGYYVVRVRAQDQIGSLDEQIVILVIRKIQVQSFQSSQSQSTSDVQSGVNEANNVNKILDQLLIPTSLQTNYEYPQVGYPTPDLPTEPNSQIINFTPQEIATKQTAPTEQDKNVITEDDVKTKAIFERQLNAAKALANLLSIIKQATANRNEALREIQKRANLLKEAKAEQFQAQESVLQAETSLERLRLGIQTTNDDINDLRKNINDLITLQEQKRLQRQSIREGIQSARKSLNDVDFQLSEKKRQLGQLQNDIGDKKSECNGLTDEVKKTNDEIGNKRIEKAALDGEIVFVERKVNDDEGKVAELKRKLADAESDLKKSKQQLNLLNGKAGQLGKTIKQLTDRLNDLQKRLQACQKGSEALDNNVDELKNNIVPDLQEKKNKIEEEIDSLTQNYDSLTQMIEELPIQIKKYEDLLNKAFENLRFLRSQSFIFENKLRNAYSEGNLANEKVARAQQNLDAAQKRFYDEEAIIQQATNNIELARIEKELADQAIEDHLREGVDILPFAAAPGQSGFEPIGGGKFAIKSWEQYVQVAYGKNVSPLFIGDLESLYSFKLSQQSIRREGQCQSKNLKAVSGYILQVLEDSFVIINEDGQQYLITYSACAMSVSNIENYRLHPGDIVVLKGQPIEDTDNQIKATQITCIRR